jgi:hypothetical protein
LTAVSFGFSLLILLSALGFVGSLIISISLVPSPSPSPSPISVVVSFLDSALSLGLLSQQSPRRAFLHIELLSSTWSHLIASSPVQSSTASRFLFEFVSLLPASRPISPSVARQALFNVLVVCTPLRSKPKGLRDALFKNRAVQSSTFTKSTSLFHLDPDAPVRLRKQKDSRRRHPILLFLATSVAPDRIPFAIASTAVAQIPSPFHLVGGADLFAKKFYRPFLV